MIHVSDEQFHALVEDAVAEIPARYADRLDNVAFMVADMPTRDQVEASGGLHGHGTLLGLYEGIPLPDRSAGYSGVVPDVITVFKNAHETMAHDFESLRRDVHRTVWHEVAHFFGLDHGQINALER
jgi:predicted Zn-dependent protease with MMP-like domain